MLKSKGTYMSLYETYEYGFCKPINIKCMFFDLSLLKAPELWALETGLLNGLSTITPIKIVLILGIPQRTKQLYYIEITYSLRIYFF